MDPLTAALTLATAIVNAHVKMLDGMTAEQRADYATLFLEDLKGWRAVLTLFKPHD